MKVTDIDSFIEEFRNGRDIWSRASIELAVREIEKQRKRIAELEQERQWIHDNVKLFCMKNDTSWCLVLPDYNNLQNSKSRWMDPILSSFIQNMLRSLQPKNEE